MEAVSELHSPRFVPFTNREVDLSKQTGYHHFKKTEKEPLLFPDKYEDKITIMGSIVVNQKD